MCEGTRSGPVSLLPVGRPLAGRWRSGDPWRADLPGNPREYLGKRDLCVRPVVVAGACHYDARYPRQGCRLTQPPGRQRAGELLLSRSDSCRGRDTEPPCDAVIRGMRAHRGQCVEHLPLLLVTGVKPLHRLLFGTGIRGEVTCHVDERVESSGCVTVRSTAQVPPIDQPSTPSFRHASWCRTAKRHRASVLW